jgi:hypothetical protein
MRSFTYLENYNKSDYFNDKIYIKYCFFNIRDYISLNEVSVFGHLVILNKTNIKENIIYFNYCWDNPFTYNELYLNDDLNKDSIGFNNALPNKNYLYDKNSLFELFHLIESIYNNLIFS